MNKLIVCRGLPASGKTTWSRQWVNESPKERVRVNRDDIRNMLGPYWVPQREDLVTHIENKCLIEAITDGFNVVLDSTNLRGIERFLNLENYDGITLRNVESIDFIKKDFTDVPIDVCIQRDAQRDEGHVGEEVIRNMANKYNL